MIKRLHLIALAVILAFAADGRSDSPKTPTTTTLLTGATSLFTGAQTTTITAVDANKNPVTYKSGNMNDVLGGYPSTFLLGTGPSVVNAGVDTVKIGSTTYTAGAGDTYANSALLLSTGNFSSPSSAPTASTAGVAFRLLGSQPSKDTVGYYSVGVDLVKNDTPGVYTGASTSLGNANVDFFVTLQLTPKSDTRVDDAAAKVYVMGTSSAAQNSTATTAWNSNSASWVQLGPTVSSGGALGNITASTTSQTAYAVNRTSSSSEDAALTFGGTFTAINSALKTIYGNSTSVQWNTGDIVRFVPLSNVGGTLDFMGINSSQGGTGTLPFATNGTAAITDAYLTGTNFSLTRHSIDGYNFGVVPEPSTWISSGAVLLAGLLARWRASRRSRS
jgi:hypothetical protein